MNLKWIASVVLMASVPASAQNQEATLPPVPPPAKPLPDVPKFDESGMPLIGFGYRCEARSGEDEFALSATFIVTPDGWAGMFNANSANLVANPAQVLGPGERSKQTWLYKGTLRWHIGWFEYGNEVAIGGPYLKPSKADLYFELTAERSMPKKGVVLSFTRSTSYPYSALIVDGHAEGEKASFSINAAEFLDYNGSGWLVGKWPFQGTNIAIDKRFGFGSIQISRVRAALANLDPLKIFKPF